MSDSWTWRVHARTVGDKFGWKTAVDKLSREIADRSADYVIEQPDLPVGVSGGVVARVGVAWFKRRGHTSAGKGYVLMSGETFAMLLKEAGW